MSISVKADTKFPNASIALAQFFTNPRSMVQFAQQVAVYPSSASAYDAHSTTMIHAPSSARAVVARTIPGWW